MDAVDQAAAAPARGPHGRWAPGQSGNPQGKAPGTRNRATRLREHLSEDDVELAVRGLMGLVGEGNGAAIRFVLERVFPKPRDREIDLGLPPVGEGTTPADVLERILRKATTGEIDLDEATRLARLVERFDRARQAGASEPPAAPAAATGSPAFDLQMAGDAAPERPAAAVPSRPLNRHERRRAAALERLARAPAEVAKAA